MKKATICMVVDNSYPNDIRVRKEAEALAKNVFEVLVVCPRKSNLKRQETINGVQVVRIGNNYSFTGKGINDILESTFKVNPFFYKHLRAVLNNYTVDFLHVHDLPLAGTGYKLKNLVKKGILLDMHENYPEAMKTWFRWKKNPFIRLKNSIFFNPTKWSTREKYYCEKYDRVICVVDEMKEKLQTNFNIPQEKLLVVSNHEEKTFSKNFGRKVAQNSIDETTFSITYVGGFGPHRGLDDTILAMPKILKTISNAKLYLIGSGSSDVERTLRELVNKKGLQEYVIFAGQVPFTEVPVIMQVSNINIIPHKADGHTNNTIPHKLFQIMMSKSLLLVSSCKPLERIVKKYDAGLVFEAGNPVDLAEKVIDIFKNYTEYLQKSENGYDAVMKQGENWEAESNKLIKMYELLLN